ncbi:unnamed protein product [Schistocephalus solidus]|uniref:Uncharacterized protein n=1 Tax=Schistocephalus solidus TaxID=70667 RepID=A0A183T864_SCHSO|nr:unnamed protein product [Schistocephalus solidus]
MHNCLNLIDYTWRESDESECTSPLHKAGQVERRFGRNMVRFQRTVTLAACDARTQRRPRSRLTRKFQGPGSCVPGIRRTLTSTDFYIPRQAPIYASWAKMRRPEFASVWYPFLHCRYKLQRDPETGAIQWNSDTNNVRCKPRWVNVCGVTDSAAELPTSIYAIFLSLCVLRRTLAEICIAYLIRDWPCVLPPQTSSSASSPNASGSDDLAAASLTGSAELSGADAPSRRPDYKNLPVRVFESLLTEAVVQRDCAAISGLVANWPGSWLNVRRLLPKEDFPLTRGYLTRPAFIASNPDSADLSSIGVLKGPSILDAFIKGLLSRQACCSLENIDFSGFEDGQSLRTSLFFAKKGGGFGWKSVFHFLEIHAG